MAAIEWLAAEGASPDAKDEHGIPAVWWAANGGHTAAVEALLWLGGDPNATTSTGSNALMQAAYWGCTECAWVLLDAGADASLRPTGGEWEGKTALEMAESRDAAEVALLLGSQSQEIKDKALYQAAEEGDAAAIERLAGEGASPDAKNEYGRPAVFEVAAKGHTAAVEALLRLGADPDATNTYDAAALMVTARDGHADATAALLEGGAATNMVTIHGSTALMFAADGGHAECARLLLEAGADASLRGTGDRWEGKTALELAEKRGKEEERCDESDEVLAARQKGCTEVVALLEARLSAAEEAEWEKRKAEIAHAALDKQLIDAADEGDAAAIERLFREGASPDAKDARGYPAVYEAASRGHTAAVEALLWLGADPDATHPAGDTALMAAAAWGHADAVAALLRGRRGGGRGGQLLLHRPHARHQLRPR
eukprot:COSAG04_NODE_1822_length_5493_cov_33.626251_2_plen_429_part_00